MGCTLTGWYWWHSAVLYLFTEAFYLWKMFYTSQRVRGWKHVSKWTHYWEALLYTHRGLTYNSNHHTMTVSNIIHIPAAKKDNPPHCFHRNICELFNFNLSYCSTSLKIDAGAVKQPACLFWPEGPKVKCLLSGIQNTLCAQERGSSS